MKISELLKIEEWWKVIAFLGIGSILLSFFGDVDFIQKKHLFGLGLGMLFMGFSNWIAEKRFSTIKPPNAYSGPAGILSWKEKRHNSMTISVFVIGFILFVLFFILILMGLI